MARSAAIRNCSTKYVWTHMSRYTRYTLYISFTPFFPQPFITQPRTAEWRVKHCSILFPSKSIPSCSIKKSLTKICCGLPGGFKKTTRRDVPRYGLGTTSSQPWWRHIFGRHSRASPPRSIMAYQVAMWRRVVFSKSAYHELWAGLGSWQAAGVSVGCHLAYVQWSPRPVDGSRHLSHESVLFDAHCDSYLWWWTSINCTPSPPSTFRSMGEPSRLWFKSATFLACLRLLFPIRKMEEKGS